MKFGISVLLFIFVVLTFGVYELEAAKGSTDVDVDPHTRGVKIVADSDGKGKFEEIKLYKKVHAIIIGIDSYPRLPQNQHLDYAVSDAKAVERVLRQKYIFHNIYTLYNEQATRAGILGLFQQLSQVSKDDAVFVFYAGHGGQDSTRFGDDIGYIVPYDGSLSSDIPNNNISMTLLKEDISKRIPAKHIFYVMNTCYGGLLLATRAGEVSSSRNIDYLRRIASEPVRQVLTAGGPDEQVLDSGPNGESVFTGRFLEILNSADDFITASEISSQISELVFSDAQARGHKQTPQYGRLFGLGDFVFMPSKAGSADSIKKQIAALEEEMRLLEQREADAIQAHQEQEQRKIQRQKAVMQAKIEAKKKKLERIDAEIKRKQQEAQQAAKEAVRRQQQEADEQARLSEVRKQVEQKRALMRTQEQSTSLEAAVAELVALNKEIEDLRRTFRDETQKRVLAILNQHKNSYTAPELVKDEFETQAEYEARIKRITGANSEDNQRTFSAVVTEMDQAYRELIKPFVQQMQAVAKQRFQFQGQDQTEVILGQYYPEGAHFPVTVKTRGLPESLAVQTKSYIKVPREGARLFKQNYVNGFITAELVAQPVTEQAIVPVTAVVIDDTNDMRYDLFEFSHVKLDDKMVFDAKNNIVWWIEIKEHHRGNPYPPHFCQNLDYKGIRGWRLPNNIERSNVPSPISHEKIYYTEKDRSGRQHIKRNGGDYQQYIDGNAYDVVACVK
ncbi:hypothetical protein TI04_06645 [Achromatium sp. WMS2]|nr:hypothetical protein TI04_06645 [Achromatium sp. WMS2]